MQEKPTVIVNNNGCGAGCGERLGGALLILVIWVLVSYACHSAPAPTGALHSPAPSAATQSLVRPA